MMCYIIVHISLRTVWTKLYLSMARKWFIMRVWARILYMPLFVGGELAGWKGLSLHLRYIHAHWLLSLSQVSVILLERRL